MLNVEELPEQTEGGEADALGTVEDVFIVMANEEDVPEPQPLVPETVMFPDEEDPEKSTVIELVFEPEAIEAPDGSVQEYPVAPEIAPAE